MTTATTATFHPFPHLPAELRTRIWELTVEPRIVEVRVLYDQPNPTYVDGFEPPVKSPPQMRYLYSLTPVPAQLQTCREAREHLTTCPYSAYRFEKAFSEIGTVPQNGTDPVRYVWFNFDKDMLSVGRTDLREFRAVAHQINRLRLRPVLPDDWYSSAEPLSIDRWFRNLTEVHLVCLEGIALGYLTTLDSDFPCRPENVYFVDPEAKGVTMMNSSDLKDMIFRDDWWVSWPAEQI
ncbi:uncharacterized protein CTRU02_207780 [Colletotrichum truncatum]|uniref:Uncharacterized protein n=1 Tax=Colletotrichum truncatum TaxID=5467 RepID=A0ACC3Z1V3_COLTU|nr:uncharacterized protein CTRU02_09120 [Colletotrichum truncatum]KAF6788799.1 hypothetical protein CTRU02_09120 [Colletotrichum truncatum]